MTQHFCEYILTSRKANPTSTFCSSLHPISVYLNCSDRISRKIWTALPISAPTLVCAYVGLANKRYRQIRLNDLRGLGRTSTTNAGALRVYLKLYVLQGLLCAFRSLHALLEDGVPARLADDEVGPLHHHDADEEGGVAGELHDLPLLVRLRADTDTRMLALERTILFDPLYPIHPVIHLTIHLVAILV